MDSKPTETLSGSTDVIPVVPAVVQQGGKEELLAANGSTVWAMAEFSRTSLPLTDWVRLDLKELSPC